MKQNLPAISGVKPLSRNEIKKDISEIECYDRSDTESTVSVLSEDVLNSTYPVKPRRHTKPKVEQRVKQVPIKEVGDIDQNIIEETIEFLRIVENARPDVFEAEQEREELEIKYQALRDMCITSEETFKKRKISLENYLKAIQSQSRNTLNVYDTLSLQNSLLYDILIALKSRRKTCQQLGIPTPLTEFSSSNQIFDNTPKDSIYFYVSQVLQTPKGIGTVISINKQNSTIIVYYSNPFPVTEEYSCSTLYNYFKKLHLQNPDIYNLLNLQYKWNPALITHQFPLGLSTPIQKNMNNIQSFTEDDLLFYIPPLTPPTTIQKNNESQPHNNNNNNNHNKKNKKSNKSIVIEDNSSSNLPSSTILTSPLIKPLIEQTDEEIIDKPLNSNISYLFIKPSTLPFVLEKSKNNIKQISPEVEKNISSSSHINLELSSQAYSSQIFKHHALPNPYDDALHETIGLDTTNDLLDYQIVDPVIENEINKLQKLVKPLLSKIRECREETRNVAIKVERSKISQIRQYQELSSLRLGLFTQQLLARQSHINSDKNFNQVDHHHHPSGNHSNDIKGNSKETTNHSRGGNNSKKKTKANSSSVASSSATSTTTAAAATTTTITGSNLQSHGNQKEVSSSNSHSTLSTQNVNESNTISQRPKRKKVEKVEEDITDQLSQDNEEPEILPTSGNSKSKRQRR